MTVTANFIRTAERKAIQHKSKLLFFYGRLVYRDEFGVKHKIGFFMQYDADMGKFLKVHRPGYNYSD